jgi:hypothetical protein
MALSNPERGRAFRNAARPILERELGVRLAQEVPLPVGRPPKDHKFDLVAEDTSWILECKNLAWRENGGVPQAKITSISEAASILMQCTNQACRRALVLSRATRPKQRESLAEYYVRLHAHNLAAAVGVAEVDTTSGSLRWLVQPKLV